ncbi:MAG: hypothetical protein J7521_03040 [Caulobacter sp.]|nr:hypothetical protein [Caulobacter sp.]
MASGLIRLWPGLLAALLCVAAVCEAAAQPYALSMAQLKHEVWTRDDGAPSVPHAMAETASGLVWIASRDGLFRFDGLSFEPMDAKIDRDKYGHPRKLQIGRDGTVWAWYSKGWLGVFRQGRLEFIEAPEPRGEVVTFTLTPDGAIWAGVAQIGQPFLRYQNARWDRISPNPERQMLRDALVSADGAFWLGYNKSVLRRAPNGVKFERVDTPLGDGGLLAADAAGRVWVVRADGGARLTGPNGRWPAPPSPAFHWTSQDPGWLAAAFDRNGNLWIKGRDFGRIAELVQAEDAGVADLVYEAGERSLMSSPRPSLLYVDRRGTLWYGGPRSLDHFSTPGVVVEPQLIQAAKYGDLLLTASSGAVYIGQSDAIYRVDPGQRPARLFDMTEPRMICEDQDKSIWIAAVDRIVRVRGGERTEFPVPPTETGFYDCGRDSTGRFWVSASTNGLYWLEGTSWKSVPASDRSPTFDPTLMVRDAQGRLWALTDPSTLTRLEGGFAEKRSLDGVLKTTSGIRALHATTLGLLMSGRDGAALMPTDGAGRIAQSQAKPLRYATGLAQTPEGDTWLFGAGGLSRIRTTDLEKAFANPAFVIPERIFSYEDGLPNGPNAQNSQTMARGGDGRLWLATIDGVAWIDPTRLPSNPVAPGVAITSLTSGATTIKDPATVKLHAGSSDVTIGFAVINLTMPRRAKVLYRLVGHDADWVDPGLRRQAFYTNLAPGTYRFHVIAANEDGVWNRAGADLEVSIPPTFLQSIWFKLLIAAALTLLAWALYSLRVRQVAAALESRFQVRTAERERIARELHDTLLQGFQSLMLRFQAVANRLSGDDPLRKEIDQALDRADVVLAEGRTRVRDLRTETARADLAQALGDVVGAFSDGAAPPIDLVIEGDARATGPLVSEEMLRIAEEAIRNAIAHAQASRISGRLTFGRGRLSLSVADDGVGLPAAVREAGEREGHYGLKGMRERAQRIGGRLAITTRPNGGTEVEVQVPARAAYLEGALAWGWLRRLALPGAAPP